MSCCRKFLDEAAIPPRMVAENVDVNNSLYADKINKKLNKFIRRRKIVNNISCNTISHTDNSLIIIKCYVGEKMSLLKVLIDSGSMENVITSKAAHKAGYTLRPSNVKMISAQGNNLEVLGSCELELNFAENQYKATAVVTSELIEGIDIILGMKFLNQHTTVLTTKPGCSPKFMIGTQNIPIIREENNKDSRFSIFNICDNDYGTVEYVKSSKRMVIPPRCIGTLKIKIPYNKDLIGKTVLFHQNDFTDNLTKGEDEIEFEIPEGALKVHETQNGKTYSYVQFINHGSNTKIINENERVGSISLLGKTETDPQPRANEKVSINLVGKMDEEERWKKVKEMLKDKTTPNSPEEEALFRVVKKYQHVVQLPTEPFKTTKTVKHRIEYEGPETLFIPPYNIAHADIEDTNKELDRLISSRHIRPSKSGFNSPIIPVRKHDKSVRLVHDYRQINRYTKKQRFPLPNIDKILASLKGAQYFVVLDLKSGYFQIPLEESSIPLTAFRTATGCYEYVQMPFGLANAPSSMQKLMLNVISGLTHCHAFLDDLLIWGKTLEECEANLARVMQRLTEHDLTVKVEKCSFFKKSCKYLGHIINENGIMPDKEKIKCIQNYPKPSDLLGVRSFLGLTGYLRKFIKNYAHIASALNDITRGYPKKGKNVKIQWGEKEEESFNALKNAISSDVILHYPDFKKEFFLTTDASDIALGGYLHQLDEQGNDRPIAFFSKKLLDCEKRYAIIDREALSVVYGLKVCRPYILGCQVTITNDNAPLIWMLKSSNPSARVARWQVLLSEYNITNIRHVSGKDNVIADALSRNISTKDTLDILLDEIPSLCTIVTQEVKDEIINWNVDELGPEQDTITLYRELKNYLRGKRAHLPRFMAAPLNQFQLEDQILYLVTKSAYDRSKFRACLPPSYYEKALLLAHNIPISGHSGVNTTLERLKEFAYWPTMVRDTKTFVKTCKICLKTKRDNSAKCPILRNPEVIKPFDRCNMDLIGPVDPSANGHRYILSMVDVLSRYGFAIPLTDKSTPTVARALINNVIGQFGPPKSIYSDSGKEFTGSIMTEVLKLMNIKQRHVTVYRPQASGIVERYNGTLCSIIRALVHEHPHTWDLSLPMATLAYNTAYHRVLKESPYFIFFMRDVNLPFHNILETPSPWYAYDDLKHEMQVRAHTCYQLAKKYIEAGQEDNERYRNVKAKRRDIRVGDRVYLKKVRNITKFGTKYIGPFRIMKILGVIFWLKELATSKIVKVHGDRLKLEEIIEKNENPNAMSTYPISEELVQDECEFVSKDELGSIGLENKTYDNEPEVEELLDRELKITDPQGLREISKENMSEAIKCNINNDSVSSEENQRYPLRNRIKKFNNS